MGGKVVPLPKSVPITAAFMPESDIGLGDPGALGTPNVSGAVEFAFAKLVGLLS
jgi:hypothetical protein